jgi:cytochrome c peroxidase
MRKVILITCIATFIVAIHACKKKEKDEPVYSPVALTVAVPDFVKTYAGEMSQPADNMLTVDGVALGRKLFYEKMLSNDNTMSCATCHKQVNAFDDPRQFSQGTNGTFGDRNAMAIVNMGWNTHFFWDGRRASLEGQAHDPVTNPIEMANKWPDVVNKLQSNGQYPDLFFKAFGTKTIDSNLVVKAIAQFERTLVSFNSKFDRYNYLGDSSALTVQEKSGLAIFKNKGMCNNCHLMNTIFTDNVMSNNGLDANPVDAGLMKFTGLATDKGKFKVPSLRNIAETAPYMHDGRFATLEQVVEHYSTGVVQSSPNLDEHMVEFGAGVNFTAQEKADLVAFLKALSDTDFLTNPLFSDPN